MAKPKTNVQIVKNIMEQSKFGSLSQAFVMEAIGRYADEISKSTPDQYPKNGFIHPESWIGVAKEILEKMK